MIFTSKKKKKRGSNPYIFVNNDQNMLFKQTLSVTNVKKESFSIGKQKVKYIYI